MSSRRKQKLKLFLKECICIEITFSKLVAERKIRHLIANELKNKILFTLKHIRIKIITFIYQQGYFIKTLPFELMGAKATDYYLQK